jgi:hypothetical protein
MISEPSGDQSGIVPRSTSCTGLEPSAFIT